MTRSVPAGYLLVLAVLLSVAASAAAPVTQTVLDNGLAVVVCPHPASEVAGVFLGFRVEAELDEPGGIRALIHEHNRARVEKLLEGDETFAPLKRAVDEGSPMKWRVEWDYLHMQARCASPQLGQLLKLLRVGVFSAQIEPELLDHGRKRLAQEYDSMPQRAAEQTYYLFREAMLGEVAASRPVFGTPESTAGITPEQASAFAEKYLQASNATIVVVAPLPSDEIVALVRDALGSLAPGQAAPQERLVVEPGDRARVDGNPLTGLATIVVGVPLPASGDEGFVVGQLLYHILAGKQGRLVRDRGLLYSLALNLPFRLLAERTPVSVLPVVMSRQPHLAIYAECDPNAVENAHQALLRHIHSLREGAIRPEELERAKLNLINAEARIMLAPGSLAEHLGQIAVLGGDPASFDQGAATVQKITKEDIIATGEAYFQNHYIGVQMPQRETGQ